MGEFNDLPHRLVFDRQQFTAEPARPAPMASHEPSDKVKEGLGAILPKIEALKTPAPAEPAASPELPQD
jgi:hypothetical protein